MSKVEIGPEFIKVSLSFYHRQMLRLIAVRGGRIEFRFNSKFQEPPGGYRGHPEPTEEQKRKIVTDSDEAVRKMGEMGLVTITPLVGAGEGKVELKLTDMGRNIIDQMKIEVKE